MLLKFIEFIVVILTLTLFAACISDAANQSEKATKPSKAKQTSSSPRSTPSTENPAANTLRQEDSVTIAFYNVENLFDNIDDKNNKGDDEYLPSSNKKWDEERYQTKLDNIHQVLKDIGNGDIPALIGLAEVENETVVNDLIKKTPIADSYATVHKDSPDHRGIDVALLYNPDLFTPTQEENLPVRFKFDPKLTTRDVLYVKGKLQGEDIHIFVNHWSSRRGGADKTEAKRIACASVVKRKLNQIFKADQDAKVVIMGDFNDNPDNRSIQKILGAQSNTEKNKAPIADNQLVSMMNSLQQSGKGTSTYQGDWYLFDQIIVSGRLLNDKKGLHTTIDGAAIFKADYMLYYNKKYKEKFPSRTYGRDRYYGGYSDHLPVYLTVGYE